MIRRRTTGGRARVAFTATLALLASSFATAPFAVAQVDPPSISVYPAEDVVNGGAFLTGTEVTIRHHGIAIGTEITDGYGDFTFDAAAAGADLEAGDAVSATDGVDTAAIVISPLAITGIDPDADTVTGVAAPAGGVAIWVHDTDAYRNLIADSVTGEWTAYFGTPGPNPGDTGTADLVPGTNGNSSQGDGGANATSASWYLPDPRFTVETPNQIWSNGEWTPDAVVAFTVDDDMDPLNGTLYEGTAVVTQGPDQGEPGFNHNTGAFVIEPWHVVTVVGTDATRVLTVAQVDVTAIDTDNETVTGLAAPGKTVELNVGSPDWEFNANRTVVANGSGEWIADYSVPAPEDSRTLDLQIGYGGSAQVFDDDGDATHRSINVPNPSFSVETPSSIWSSNSDWTVGSTVALTVDDPSTPEVPDYDGVATVESWGPNPWEVGFHHETGGFMIESGDVVTASTVGIAKTLVVDPIEITAVDVDDETVTGLAPPGATVEVNMGNWEYGVNRAALADGDGVWVADFSVPAPADDRTLDLGPGYGGSAQIFDDDNDSTHRSIHIPNPTFTVDAWSVWGEDFEPSTQLSITLNGTEIERPTTDEWGNFGIEYDQNEGVGFVADDAVTVFDGVTTKEHTVTELTITLIDPVAETVSGTAAPGTDVSIWVHDTDAHRNVVADAATGAWVADFANPGPNPGDNSTADLGAGSNGNSGQGDDDGDSTFVGWRLPNPSFTVDPVFDQVWGNEFEADTSVTVHLDGVLVDTVTTDMWGNFNLNAATGVHDFASTNVVDVSDGVTTKSHEITPLAVTSVDVDADTVSGVAEPGSWLDVWTHDSQVGVTVQADGAGVWVADFNGLADLVPETNGNSNQCDDDGDCTQASWAAANPTITASVTHDEVWAMNWPTDPAGMLLYFQLDDPDTPELDVEGDMPLLVTPGGTEAGDRSFGIYDIAPEWVLTVRNRPFGEPLGDGIERVVVVSYLEVTDVDADLDTISGYADPAEGDRLCVWSNDQQMCSDQPGFTWSPDGTWVADFASIGSDVRPGHWNEAQQYDAEGDSTHFWWNLPPWVVVELAPEDEFGDPIWPDAIRAESWTGPTVTVTIDRGGSTAFTGEIVVDNEWQNTIELPDFDVEPGDIVTLTDGIDTKTITVETLSVEHVNFSTGIPPNVIEGSANPYRNVRVELTASIGGRWAERWVNANGAGDWLADFDNPGQGWREQWTVELGGPQGLGRHVRIEVYDDDNDRTEARHCEGIPRIEVSRFDNRVTVYDYPAGVTVTIEIDDPNTPESPDYIATGVSMPNPDNPCETIIEFTIVDYVIPEGAAVTADDGTTTVVHQTIAFTIDVVDQDVDTVSGSAPEGTEVLVEADGQWRYPVADEFDSWLADFATAGTEPGEEQTVDLGPGSSGRAIAYDAQGNTTELTWRIPASHFQVDPTRESLWANEFEPNSEITVTVNGAEVPGSPFGTDANGFVETGFDPNVLDIAEGDAIVVADGLTTKDHTVTGLAITDVVEESNTVSGIAEPFSYVRVAEHQSGANIEVQADEFGSWTADFTGLVELQFGMQGDANQCDDDGDCTQIPWFATQTSFVVQPDSEGIWGIEFVQNSEVTITVNGDPVPGSPLPTGPNGGFGTNFDPAVLDIETGDVVVVSDGETTHTHTVTDVQFVAVDVDVDTITGTAEPESEVQVEVWGHGLTHTIAALDGTWMVFTNVEEFEFYDLQPGDTLSAIQPDDDGDTTERYWTIRAPQFQVDPNQGSIWANRFEPGSSIDVTIDGVPAGTFPTNGEGNFDGNEFGLTFDVAAGSEVAITDGTNTKDHTVTNLMVTGIDVVTDTVFGTADPDSFVQVWVHDESNPYLEVQADESGEWAADFTGTADLVAGSNGNSQQCDDDNDCTMAGWWVRNPNFAVDPNQEGIWGHEWTPDSEVTIAVNGVPVPGSPFSTGGDGNFGADFDPDDDVFAVGDLVVVSDGDTTKTHTVLDVTVTAVDDDNETVSGTAEPYAEIQVLAAGSGFDWRVVVADEFGNWTVDFTPRDLQPGDDGFAEQHDDDDDSTRAGWRVANPAFSVETPNGVWSGAEYTEWVVGSIVTVTVDDDEDIGNGVLFTGTTTVVEWGFGLDTDPFVIEPDHVVTVTDGDTTKVLYVTDVQVTDVDEDADTVSGTAPPDTWVEVDAGNEFEGAHRSVMSDEFGDWTAEFATGTPEQPETLDLAVGVNGAAQVFDDDEDSTHRGFQVAEPVEITSAVLDPVDPIQTGETVTLTVEFTGDADAAFVDWGDYVEQVDVGESPLIVDRTYLEPGVYTIEVTLIGHDGSAATAWPGFAVVYDPTGGSISVNGSFGWPDGAVPAAAGEAKVGASAHYKNGEPTGNFKFEFTPDDGSGKLQFKETTFDTLVISSTFTYLRGTGTFDGDPTVYTFRLTAVDGELPGGAGDVVRVVILDGNTVVWDSQPGDGAGAIPATPIENGQVKVRPA